ncbi:MAG: Holliday junction resolvase RuvX [Planctomycetota bacterium]|nr:Holliday junction resolvase RuvX [Planctomycetota bacterium]
MRFLVVDIGDRRTGFAAGDDIMRIMSPLEVVHAPTRDEVLRAIFEKVKDHGPDAIVLGLPIHMDGSESERSRAAREFAEFLRTKTTIPVHLQDERLTSFDAEDRLKQSGKTHGEKKQLRDALAACAIGEDFLRALQGDGA